MASYSNYLHRIVQLLKIAERKNWQASLHLSSHLEFTKLACNEDKCLNTTFQIYLLGNSRNGRWSMQSSNRTLATETEGSTDKPW